MVDRDDELKNDRNGNKNGNSAVETPTIPGMTLKTLLAADSKPRLDTAYILVMVASCAVIPGTFAASYPDHPVRLIVPSPPGGGTDTSTRIIAPKLAEYLGQPIVIDNRGGASGNIGAEMVARAPADGYTLLACIASHTSNPAVMKHVPYDFARDFAPISLTVTLPNVLVSHPSLPAKTVRELIAFAKARPGQLQFATGGVGANQHLAMELFLNETGLKMIHVPYKGVGPALIDVVAGHVPLMMGNILVALPHIRSGRVRAFGVTSAKRASGAPDIPTIAESGLPGYEAVQWYGLLAPAGTPREIVSKLHAGVVHALQDPVIRKRFVDDGAEPTPSSTPDEFGAFIRAELAKWAKVVKNAGIQAE
jgi:tripartite-type tricarboxylate transporter receptor subunit TctC